METSRRKFLRIAVGTGISGFMLGRVRGGEISGILFEPLDQHTRIDIGERGAEMMQTAYQTGYAYEQEYGGCARCTVAALQDAVTFIPNDKDVYRTACCLDGGATPTRMANCGGFTGSGIIIGYLCGNNEFGNTVLSHKLIREVHGKFQEAYGSVLCKDVRKHKNDCPEVVGRAVLWTTESVLKQFTNYA